MKTKKPAATEQSLDLPPGVQASRPRMPAEYGLPAHTEGLLPWSYVRQRMSDAKYYWIATVSPDGHPHATPVDGLWLDDRLYFGGSPQTRWNRNLDNNPAVCVHLESGAEVLILHGEASMIIPDQPFTVLLAEGSARKYGYPMQPELYAPGVREFRPRVVYAWSQFPKDVTRWTITLPEAT
jgi:hypothetical protein